MSKYTYEIVDAVVNGNMESITVWTGMVHRATDGCCILGRCWIKDRENVYVSVNYMKTEMILNGIPAQTTRDEMDAIVKKVYSLLGNNPDNIENILYQIID